MSEKEQDIDYEAEASKQGWRPLEEWKGDPDQWKSAQQFVEDGETILPLVRKKNHDLEAKVEELIARVDSLTHSNAELNKMSQKVINREKAERKKLVTELEEMRAKAITEGDGDAFRQAEKQIKELGDDAPEQAPLPPGGQEFLDRNKWFGSDEDMTAYANGIADRLAERGFSGKAYFAELERRVKENFSARFENPRKKEPSAVETEGEHEVSNGKERKFENLPAEAKRAFKQFEKDIPGFTKEQYLEQYEWE